MCIRRAGFRLGLSLLEMMLVVILVSIIASIVIARVSQATDTAKCKSCRLNRIELNSAIERYGVSTGTFPNDLTDLAVPDYFPQGIPVCPVSGGAYSMNSTTHRLDGHTSNTVPGDH